MPPALSDAPGLPALAGVLAALVLALWPALWLWRRQRRPLAVIDGSNVMFWKTGTPTLESVAEVIAAVEAAGYAAGVIFDANAGYRLRGAYLSDRALGRTLGLRRDRVLVVPRGTQADPFLLDFAQKARAIIISNDRFRDRIGSYPDLAQPGRRVRGGWHAGRLVLDLPARRRRGPFRPAPLGPILRG